MKKVMLFCLGALMVACPSACVDDPTASDATCSETSTETCVEVSTDVEQDSMSDVDTSTETVVE